VTPEEFRAAAHVLVDWIADHRARLADLPVRSAVAPGQVAAALPAAPPEHPEPLAAVLADLERIVVPGLTHPQHPRYAAWFPANASLSSVLGDMASSGLGVLGISWESAPALTELEEVVCDWLRRLAGLSEGWHGVIQDTASTACLVALIAARERACGHRAEDGGLQSAPAPLTVHVSEEAHSSVAKAAVLAGIGRANVRTVAVDPVTRAMDPRALAEGMAADRAAGRVPAAVVATVGTTSTTAVDPLAAILPVAARHGAWVHVDAAMAGSALLLPECRWMVDGIDGAPGVPGADSLSWNPHKWMGTVLDCSLMYVRDPAALTRVMGSTAAYLRSGADGAVTQYRDWGVPLGRRFRALKPWFQLRLDGPEAIRARLRRDMANARELEARVRAEPGWRVLAPVVLQTVCVRHEPPGLAGDALDAHTLRWAAEVNASGRAFVTPSRLDGRWMVRVSIGAEPTELGDVLAIWDLMREAAAAA
jgi:aromatic-L-amino-acid decarboxylase